MWQGACICMAGGICGRGCMVGGMHGRGHAWQVGECVCVGGGMHCRGECGRGHVWQGGVHGRGHVWQERQPLQRTVRILLECILVLSNDDLYFSPISVGKTSKF